MHTPAYFRAVGILGILATGVYLAKTFIPMPAFPHLLLCMAFGPLIIAGSPGLARFLRGERPGLIVDAARSFAIVAGAFHLAMVCVQTTTLTLLRERIREAADEGVKTDYAHVLNGVFTVQLGLCFVWDLCISLATILFSIALFARGLSGRILGTLGLVVAGTFLTMKFYTYPLPPAEAGLFDLGPGLGAWFLVFSILVLVQAPRAGRALQAN